MTMKKLTRRKFLKQITGLGIGTFLFSASGYTYARYIEPMLLTTTEKILTSKKIPKSFNGIKIIQFSDTHLGHYYTLENLSKLVNKINSFEPHIILFTGDLIDAPDKYALLNHISPVLKKLTAPLGKFAIYGNHDHGGYGSNHYKKIMKDSNFTLLVNESQTIQIDNGYIVIAGLDDAMLSKPDIPITLRGVDTGAYTIMMVHEPDLADLVSQYQVDVQLSGHSHGGQVQLPLYGPLITPPFAKRYVEGMYHIKDSDLKLYVNRGIGTTRMPFRFFSIPELTIFTLERDD